MLKSTNVYGVALAWLLKSSTLGTLKEKGACYQTSPRSRRFCHKTVDHEECRVNIALGLIINKCEKIQ